MELCTSVLVFVCPREVAWYGVELASLEAATLVPLAAAAVAPFAWLALLLLTRALLPLFYLLIGERQVVQHRLRLGLVEELVDRDLCTNSKNVDVKLRHRSRLRRPSRSAYSAAGRLACRCCLYWFARSVSWPRRAERPAPS
jgi:hypothetical protein